MAQQKGTKQHIFQFKKTAGDVGLPVFPKPSNCASRKLPSICLYVASSSSWSSHKEIESTLCQDHCLLQPKSLSLGANFLWVNLMKFLPFAASLLSGNGCTCHKSIYMYMCLTIYIIYLTVLCISVHPGKHTSIYALTHKCTVP